MPEKTVDVKIRVNAAELDKLGAAAGRLGGKISKVGDAAVGGGKGVSTMGRAMGEARARAEAMGAQMGPLGAVMAKIGPAGLAAAVGVLAISKAMIASVKSASQFQQAMQNLSAITGATGKNLEFLAVKAKEIGRTTNLSAVQAADAFKLIASAKPELLESADALAEVTKQATILAQAAGLDLPSAANTLVSALNQFSQGAEQAGRFMNVLAAGSKLGASEIPNLGVAITKAGTVAADAGVSFEELNAVLQRLAAFGAPAEEFGTAFRNVLLTLQKEGGKLGVSLEQGLFPALDQLAKKQLSTAALLEIFGKRNVVVAKQLLLSRDSMQALTGAITDTNIGLEQSEARMDSLAGDVEFLQSAFEGLKITIGTSLIPSLRSVVASTTDVINKMNELTEFVNANTGIEFDIKTGAGVAALTTLLVALGKTRAALIVGAAAAQEYVLQTNIEAARPIIERIVEERKEREKLAEQYVQLAHDAALAAEGYALLSTNAGVVNEHHEDMSQSVSTTNALVSSARTQWEDYGEQMSRVKVEVEELTSAQLDAIAALQQTGIELELQNLIVQRGLNQGKDRAGIGIDLKVAAAAEELGVSSVEGEAALQQLREQLELQAKLAGRLKETTAATRGTSAAIKDYGEKLATQLLVEEERLKQLQAVVAAGGTLEAQERALVVAAAQSKAKTAEQRKEFGALAGQLFDTKTAVDALTDAQKEQQQQAERTLEARGGLKEEIGLLEDAAELYEAAAAGVLSLADAERVLAVRRAEATAEEGTEDLAVRLELAKQHADDLRDIAQEATFNIGESITDIFDEVVVGIARGTNESIDAFELLKQSGSALFAKMLSNMIQDKLSFDKFISKNFLRDIPGVINEGLGTIGKLFGGGGGGVGTVGTAFDVGTGGGFLSGGTGGTLDTSGLVSGIGRTAGGKLVGSALTGSSILVTNLVATGGNLGASVALANAGIQLSGPGGVTAAGQSLGSAVLGGRVSAPGVSPKGISGAGLTLAGIGIAGDFLGENTGLLPSQQQLGGVVGAGTIAAGAGLVTAGVVGGITGGTAGAIGGVTGGLFGTTGAVGGAGATGLAGLSATGIGAIVAAAIVVVFAALQAAGVFDDTKTGGTKFRQGFARFLSDEEGNIPFFSGRNANRNAALTGFVDLPPGHERDFPAFGIRNIEARLEQEAAARGDLGGEFNIDELNQFFLDPRHPNFVPPVNAPGSSGFGLAPVPQFDDQGNLLPSGSLGISQPGAGGGPILVGPGGIQAPNFGTRPDTSRRGPGQLPFDPRGFGFVPGAANELITTNASANSIFNQAQRQFILESQERLKLSRVGRLQSTAAAVGFRAVVGFDAQGESSNINVPQRALAAQALLLANIEEKGLDAAEAMAVFRGAILGLGTGQEIVQKINESFTSGFNDLSIQQYRDALQGLSTVFFEDLPLGVRASDVALALLNERLGTSTQAVGQGFIEVIEQGVITFQELEDAIQDTATAAQLITPALQNAFAIAFQNPTVSDVEIEQQVFAEIETAMAKAVSEGLLAGLIQSTFNATVLLPFTEAMRTALQSLADEEINFEEARSLILDAAAQAKVALSDLGPIIRDVAQLGRDIADAFDFAGTALADAIDPLTVTSRNLAETVVTLATAIVRLEAAQEAFDRRLSIQIAQLRNQATSGFADAALAALREEGAALHAEFFQVPTGPVAGIVGPAGDVTLAGAKTLDEQAAALDRLEFIANTFLETRVAQIQQELADATRVHQQRIDDLNDEATTIRDNAQAAVDLRQEELDLINEQLAVAQQWQAVVDTVDRTLLSIATGQNSPEDPLARLSLLQAEFATQRGAFSEEDASVEDRAAAAQQLSQLAPQILQLATQAGIPQSSEAFRALFGDVAGVLEAVRDEAAEGAVGIEDLQERANELTEEIRDIQETANEALGDIQDAIEAEQDAIEAAQDRATAQIELVKLNTAAYLEWVRGEGNRIFQEKQDALAAKLERLGIANIDLESIEADSFVELRKIRLILEGRGDQLFSGDQQNTGQLGLTRGGQRALETNLPTLGGDAGATFQGLETLRGVGGFGDIRALSVEDPFLAELQSMLFSLFPDTRGDFGAFINTIFALQQKIADPDTFQPILGFDVGGVTRRDQMAQLHANEFVAPLSRLPEFAAAFGGGGTQASITVNVTMNIDGADVDDPATFKRRVGRMMGEVMQETMREHQGVRAEVRTIAKDA